MDSQQMKLAKSLVAGAAMLSLAGCGSLFGPEGYFRDRGDDYLKARTVPPVRLPQGVNSSSIGQLFVIPPVADAGVPLPEEFEVPRPLDAGASGEQRNEVKIQKLGERRWIAVNSAPAAVWPRVRGFLEERGLGLAVQDPTAGVLETQWLSVKDEASGDRDRYRLELQQGLHTNSTEVHVLQMTVPAAAATGNRPDWPRTSANPEREDWMIRELSGYLAKEETMQASMLAQSIGSSERRVELVSGADPYLLLHVDYSRAWASVGGALNRDGFHVDSSDREQGRLSVSYAAANAETTEEPAAPDGSLGSRFMRIFDFSDGNRASAADADAVYRVQLLQDQTGSVRVTVRTPEDKLPGQAEAESVLRRIRANLP